MKDSSLPSSSPADSKRRLLPMLVGTLLVASLVLQACALPVIMEPGFYDTRSNLGEGIPPFIAIGKTTRAEVVVNLGEPDIQALDGRWFFYVSDYLKSASGIVVIMFSAGKGGALPLVDTEVIFRRLFVGFSADGIVESANYYIQECQGVPPSAFADTRSAEKCPLLRRDLELRQQRQNERMRAAVPEGDRDVRWFERALWVQGKRAGWYSSTELRCMDNHNTGMLSISTQSITFLPREQKPTGHSVKFTRISRSEIAKVEMINPFLNEDVGIDILLKNGNSASFALCEEDNFHPDRKQHRAILPLLQTPNP